MEGGCKLTNREFIVEIMDAKLEEKLTKEIINCDGKIGNYIDEKHPPFMVISDSPIAAKLEKMTCEEQREFNKKAKLPMLLRDAVQNRVKIAYAVNFLDKLKQRKSLKLQPILARPSAKRSVERDFPFSTERKRTAFCVRIEDEGREFAPLQKELETLPVMYTGKDYGASLFLKSDETTRAKRRDELQQEKDGNLKYVNVDSQTAGANNNKPPNKQTGNCEICNRRVSNLQEHYGSKEHLKNTSAPGFFDEVDQYIGSYVPHIKCPGKPVLLRRPRTPSPVLEFEDYVYGETDFGRLSDDE